MTWRTVLAFPLLAASFAFAQADPFRPSMQDQVKLGQKAAEQVRKEEKVLPASDPRVKELRRLGEMLVNSIPEKERKSRPFVYTFDVIDSKELNAFAFPGGSIFFYTGLLDTMKTEDEIVGILGHEITHSRNQHWASQYGDTLKRKLGIAVLLNIANANSTVFDIADMLDSVLVGLKYSRKHETESDNVGYEMVVSTGYNPAGMIETFKTLKAASKGQRPPEWLSTHPDLDRRVVNLEKKMAADKRKFPAVRSRAANTMVVWKSGWPSIVDASKEAERLKLLRSQNWQRTADQFDCCAQH